MTMLASRLRASANRLRLLGLFGLMAGDATHVDRALQCVDGLAVIEDAQQLTTKDIVEKQSHRNSVRGNRPRWTRYTIRLQQATRRESWQELLS
jgi:hypothetical protein